MITKKDIRILYCKRCGYQWVPRVSQVTTCPRCTSPFWNKEKVRFFDTRKQTKKTVTKNLIIIDVETTGRDIFKHSICELGAVKLDNNLNITDRFNTPNYIKPFNNSFDPEAMKIHNIPISKLTASDTPHFKQVSDDFNKWTGNFSLFMLASWGVSFDMTFLEYSYKYVKQPWFFNYRYLDIRTLVIWEMNKLNFDDSLSLKDVCLHYNVPVDEAKYHTALGDAEIAAQLLKKIIPFIKGNNLFFHNPESSVSIFNYE